MDHLHFSELTRPDLVSQSHKHLTSKRNAFSTWDSRVVSNLTTNQALFILTSVIEMGTGVSWRIWPKTEVKMFACCWSNTRLDLFPQMVEIVLSGIPFLYQLNCQNLQCDSEVVPYRSFELLTISWIRNTSNMSKRCWRVHTAIRRTWFKLSQMGSRAHL